MQNLQINVLYQKQLMPNKKCWVNQKKGITQIVSYAKLHFNKIHSN